MRTSQNSKDPSVPVKIREALKERDRKCAQLDPNDEYRRPERNPYDYKSVEEFKRKHPFNPQRDCKYINPDSFRSPVDPYNRFYTDIRSKRECDNANGVWSTSSVNRKYRYEQGVCWKRLNNHAHCSQYEAPELLKPGHENNPNIIRAASKKCNLDPKCTWVKLEKSYDCFSKEAANQLPQSSSIPPDEMPIDITNDNGNIEQFLQNFYANGKVPDNRFQLMKNQFKYVNPPKTTPLFGEGNRCMSSVVNTPKNTTPENESDEEFSLKTKKKERIPNANEKIIVDEHQDTTFTPSLSQSVINMIMKNIAIKEQKGENVTNRGLLAWHSTGSGKCHAIDTPILMYDGSIKMVQNIEVGDMIMGDDSTPRRVLSLGRGEDEMYDIIPVKGETYRVNSEHILVLRHTFKTCVSYVKRQVNYPYKATYLDKQSLRIKSKSFKTKDEARAFMALFTPEDKTIEIEVKDFLKLPKTTKAQLKGIRVGIEFPSREVDFDPWMIGYWLGDGSKRDPVISTADKEVIDYFRNNLPTYQLSLNYQSGYDYRISCETIRGKHGKNNMLNVLKKHNLIDNKHIPSLYKINDRNIRLRILAGLIDSDGYCTKCNCFDIIQKSKMLAEDIVYLCRSLGFAAYCTRCTKSHTYDGKKVSGLYYRISVSGYGLEQIPTILSRKKASVRKQIKDPLVTGITVKSVGRGKYYGFTLDGNHRYVMGDFTVTHNTCTAAGVMDAFWNSKRDIIFASSLDALASNPQSTFHECLYNLYPDFQKEPFAGKSKEDTLRNIAHAFEQRNIRFLSFAKLSNRLKKTLESGILSKKGGNAKLHAKSKAKQPAKPKSKAKATSMSPKTSKQMKKIPVQKTTPTKKAPTKPQTVITKDDIIDLNNTILIIDEVHNLFRPLATQKTQHEYLKKKLIDPTLFPGLKIVILSATPGDNVDDILMLLNMIRDPTHPVIKAPDTNNVDSVTKFKQDVRGLISYFDMSGDTTRFPILNELEPLLVPMGDEQFQKYVEAYKKTEKEKKTTDYQRLAKDNQLYKYWAPARKYSNMLFTLEKGMRMGEFGAKLPILLDNIRAYPTEKHYVYSAFSDNRNKGWSSQGILTIANFLEKELGYVRFSLNDVKFECTENKQTGQKDCTIARLPDRRKRYILVTSKEMGDDGTGQNKSAGERLKKMLKVFNHPDNRYGDIVHVMLASNSYNEGIDLKAVRHIHFFEPLVTMASDKQTLGRAARFCSHADLDREKGEWTVSVHRYMSHYPVNIELNTTNRTALIQQPVQGPTADENAKIREKEDEINQAYNELADINKELDGLKGKAKQDNIKTLKDNLKVRVQTLKGVIKENVKYIKDLKKIIEARDKEAAKLQKASNRKNQKNIKYVDTNDIKMIDEFIFNESREHMKAILTIYQSMKEAAIDCRLLGKFHAMSGNNKITCESFAKDFKAKDVGVLDAFKKLNPFFFGR